MKRSEYLSDSCVSAFIDWTAKKIVTGKWGLVQSWESNDNQGRNPSSWDCESLYQAYGKYYWNGDSFQVMAARFDEFRLGVQVPENPTVWDKRKFLNTANDIVQWSCKPLPSLMKMRLEALAILKANAVLLDPRSADTDDLWRVTHMGAGYSKIYSAMIDDFPIYDSRVGCALTSLIKQFCKENALPQVPKLLRLGIPSNPGKICRNSSDEDYQFTTIEDEEGYMNSESRLKAGRLLVEFGSPTGRFSKLPEYMRVSTLEKQWSRIGYKPSSVSYEHADSNLKAAWILGELAEIAEGDFSKVCRNRRVRALEAALFMIGYQPLGEDAVRKS